MEPVSAALAIAIPLIGLLVWWIKRKAAKADDPVERFKKAHDEIDQAISRGGDGVGDVNRIIAEFERMQNSRSGNTSEQGDQIRRDELHSSSCCNANPASQPTERN